jgi:GT2 family glycosyltransferase
MRVLAHIHTMNDAAVIEQALEGLRRQTRPPDAIVIVDNASVDETLDRTFPDNVTIIRNPQNLGTSGAIRIGFAHALQHGFDWTWVFDADSVAEPDALEKLLALFQRLSPSERERVCFLACRLENAEGEVRHEPATFAGPTVKLAPIEAGAGHIQCDFFAWTGSLFRMQAVAKIGLPSADYVLDVAEVEYGYRARQLGLTSYMICDAVTHQDVGRSPGAATRLYRFGPISITFHDISPPRSYYSVRNIIYFWLYQHKPRRISRALHWVAWRVAGLTLTFVLRPRRHAAQTLACFRGIWHGVTGNMAARY